MQEPNATTPDPLEHELIGVALRYVVFTDWFEAQPVRRISSKRERRMMAMFNRIENELRIIGRRALKKNPYRELIGQELLAQAGK
jgi:hypothetical protein